MGLNPFSSRKKEIFTPEEKDKIAAVLREAEKRTSGEVRVFIESRCRYVDAIDRAEEVFLSLKMEMTAKRNAVLVYLAWKDRQVAIYGDNGINAAVGESFWNNEVQKMIHRFKQHDYAEGLCEIIRDIGNALHQHFPYDGSSDKNELPDDIVFGK